MWLCTTLGFYSIVQKDADTHHIRARCREDLEALTAVLERSVGTPTETTWWLQVPLTAALERSAGTPARRTLHPVASYPGSDYPWRILCPSSALPAVFQVLAGSIDYGNFKSAIASSPSQRDKLSAYHDIHHRMIDWQENNLCSSET